MRADFGAHDTEVVLANIFLVPALVKRILQLRQPIFLDLSIERALANPEQIRRLPTIPPGLLQRRFDYGSLHFIHLGARRHHYDVRRGSFVTWPNGGYGTVLNGSRRHYLTNERPPRSSQRRRTPIAVHSAPQVLHLELQFQKAAQNEQARKKASLTTYLKTNNLEYVALNNEAYLMAQSPMLAQNNKALPSAGGLKQFVDAMNGKYQTWPAKSVKGNMMRQNKRSKKLCKNDRPHLG